MVKTTPIQFSILTPQGRGAIATIVVVGEGCFELVNELFKPKRNRSIGIKDIRRAIYGNWIIDDRLGEDLIVCPLTNNRFEIHCHGGKVAIDVIASSLIVHGAEQIESMDFGSTIFGNQYLADFNWTVIQAQTLRLAKLILSQRQTQKTWLCRLQLLIEKGQSKELIETLEDCLDWWDFGRRISDFWDVVFCGKPNVGKSSLTNAVVGFKRAIVDDVAGTTRDVVDQITAIDGWPVRIIDTAGFRSADNQIETMGIELAQQRIDSADCTILVLDAADHFEADFENQLKQWSPDIVAINKSDLSNKVEIAHPHVRVSAKTKVGISGLMEKIVENLIPKVPSAKSPIPISRYQFQLFSRLCSLAKNEHYSELANEIRILLEVNSFSN